MVSGKPKAPDKGKVDWIMQVVGVAIGVKKGETDKGPWYAFTGSFQATDLKTGKVFRSGLCFMPEVVGNLLLAQVLTETVKAVEFGFNIGVKGDESSVTGYIYVGEPILSLSENDPVDALLLKLPAGKKPKELAQPEDKVARK